MSRLKFSPVGAVTAVLAFTAGIVFATLAPDAPGVPAPGVPAPASTPAVTEDSPGRDCLRQGNLTCRINGVLVTSLEGMPSDPYERCGFLLKIPARLGELSYADTVCSPIASQRG